jgi:hypothetical protein
MSRFDPTTPLESTPPFVRWTLALGCPLRETTDYFDPDQTERLLRGARCTSDAVAEGRLQDGIALQSGAITVDSLGFDVQSVLEPLGGESLVRKSCVGCPANALGKENPNALAGCFGHVIPPMDDYFHWVCGKIAGWIFRAIPDFANIFLQTEAVWPGLWIDERPTKNQLLAQQLIFQRLTLLREDVIGLAEYMLAIDAALDYDIPLIVRAYPGGRCEGRRWYVEPHCDRCKSSWPEARRQQCRVCGQVGGRQPERRRMRMGTRPYRPLREFLTPEQLRSIGF